MKPATNQVFRDTSTNTIYKVLSVLADSNIVLFKITKGEHVDMPYRESPEFLSKPQMRLLDHDPTKIDRLEDELSDAEKSYRDFRMNSIRELVNNVEVFDPKWRSKEIDFLSRKEGNLKRTALYNLLKKFWANGCDDNALLPDFRFCGAPGMRKTVTGNPLGRKKKVPSVDYVLTDDMKDTIGKAFKRFYIQNRKNSLRQAYIDFLAYENLKGNTRPSLRQFVYWGNQLNDQLEILRKRTGVIKYLKDHRLLKGTVRDNAFGPLSEVMIDSTIDNVRVLSVDRPNLYIGRLTVYFTVDVFSGLITGIYVTPEHPSYLVGCMCIVNTTEDKVEFCERYGVNITEDQWPCQHLPFRLIADRGEFVSDAASALAKNLNITLTNTPSYRADLKSLVEIQMNVFQTRLKGILADYGLIDKNDESRLVSDTRKKATLTLHDMMNLIIREILFYNKNHWIDSYPLTADMMRGNIKPTPLDIFKWGIANGLGYYRKLDKATVWRNCLPTKTFSVSREGIFIKPYHFFPEDEKHDELIEKLAINTKVCEVSFHPLDIRQTYLRHEQSLIPLFPKEKISFESFIEMENFNVDQSERKTIHEREALDDEVEKRQLDNDLLRKAKERRPKDINISNARDSRKSEIEAHKEAKIAEVDPQVVKNGSRVENRKTKGYSSGLPSLSGTLTKMFDN